MHRSAESTADRPAFGRTRSGATIVAIAGAVSALLGILVLVGWYTESVALLQLRPWLAPMPYNSALAFLACGIGLLALTRQRRRTSIIAGSLALVLGLLTAVEYVEAIDLGLDQLLVEHRITVETSHPGRMAPNSALCFVLSGAGIVVRSVGRWRAQRNGVTAWLGAMVFGLGLVALAGYVTQVETAYGWGSLTRMAVHASLGFLVLGVGLLALAAEDVVGGEGALMQWLRGPAVITSMTVAVALLAALTDQERTGTRRLLKDEASRFAESFDAQFRLHIQALERMSERWAARGATPRVEWESDAAHYVEHMAGLRAVARVGPDYRVEWIVALEGDEAEPGLDLGVAPTWRETFDAAGATGQATVTPVRDGQFRVIAPVLGGVDADGFTVGQFHVAELVARPVSDLVQRGYNIEITEGGEPIFESEAPGAGSEERSIAAGRMLSLGSRRWFVRVRPSARVSHGSDAVMPVLSPMLALFVGGLLVLVLDRSSRAKERGVAAAVARDDRDEARRLFAEQTKLRAELEAQATALARSNADLEQFAYVASHDLQEPLRMVASYAELLRERYHGQLDARADKYIDYAVDGARRMQQLISDLLSVARSTSQPLSIERVDCGKLVDRLVSEMRISLREADGVVTHDKLPTVSADATLLAQVFRNLLGNAIKFRGTHKPRVQILARRQAEAWEFSVEDNGIGIEAGQIDRIFRMFQRLHGPGEYKGSGIGLALVQRIIDRHGGEVRVESELGSGSRFVFTIPDAASDGEPGPA